MTLNDDSVQSVSLNDKLRNRKIVLFGLPGAYTNTCSNAHLPSFIRNMEPLKGKGVDEVICVSVNDPFVMNAWDESSGAGAAGVTMLADPRGELANALGTLFNAPGIGLINRSARYSMFIDNEVVIKFLLEDEVGICNVTTAETLLAAI